MNKKFNLSTLVALIVTSSSLLLSVSAWAGKPNQNGYSNVNWHCNYMIGADGYIDVGGITHDTYDSTLPHTVICNAGEVCKTEVAEPGQRVLLLGAKINSKKVGNDVVVDVHMGGINKLVNAESPWSVDSGFLNPCINHESLGNLSSIFFGYTEGRNNAPGRVTFFIHE